MTLARLTLVLPLFALAACQTSLSDNEPESPPRTPGVTVTAKNPAVSDAAAAAAAEARTGVVPGTLPTPAN